MNYQIVIHVGYGGFHVNQEMADWLEKNRAWILIDNKDYDHKAVYPLHTLVKLGSDHYFNPDKNELEFRCDQDLIDCVREIKKCHEDDKFPDSRYHLIHKLRIVNLDVKIEIENYNDGYEKVVCRALSEEIDE